MWRWGLGVAAGLVVISGLSWSAGQRDAQDEVNREPSQAERIMEFCREKGNADSPLCSVDPEDDEAVTDAVRDAIARQTSGPQIIERDREIVRGTDDDDDDAPPRVEVNVPASGSSTQQPSPTPAPTTRPPMIPEVNIPEVPDVPEIPNLGLPLLP